MARTSPTIADILRDLAASYSGPVTEQALYDRVLAIRPSGAKNPTASIRNLLRYGATRHGWVWLGNSELIPLHAVLTGLRFRVVPDTEELTGGAFVALTLRPFIPLNAAVQRLEDVYGNPIALATTTAKVNGIFGSTALPALDLRDWLRNTRFAPGDSMLLMVVALEPLTLQLEHEPAARFRADEVIGRDRELTEAIVQLVDQSGTRSALFAEDVLLPIYARASWRSAYPGRPWRDLVASDRRLRLLDYDQISAADFRRPLDWLVGTPDPQIAAAEDARLLDEIFALQADLLASRTADASRGVWDGNLPRESTTRLILDIPSGEVDTVSFGTISGIQDHRADIEEHVAHGDYETDEWTEDDDAILQHDLDVLSDDDFDDDEDDDLSDDLDQLSGLEHPGALLDADLSDATRRLIDSLSPEDAERLSRARTLLDAQEIVAPYLAELMRREPDLFVPLDLSPADQSNGNGHSNGNGNGVVIHQLSSDDLHSLDNDAAFQLWLGPRTDEDGGPDDVLEHSNALIARFYEHQIAAGRSQTTAANRSRDLWLYADFLASFYGRGLEGGDYATLDECLFFYYPRRVFNTSERAIREICTSLKQFYQFLLAESTIEDASFATAIWERRDQAARVVALYDQLDASSDLFARQFGHLFAPYTA